MFSSMAARIGVLGMVLAAAGAVFAQGAQSPAANPPAAQQQQQPKTPDVVFVPTPNEVVTTMLSMVNAGPGDIHYDLGSGDGRIVIAAARRGVTKTIGFDVDPKRIAEARENARVAGVPDKVRFVQQDLFSVDLHEPSVVTLYLLESLNQKLRPKLLSQLKPGSRIVSHAFTMGDWAADAHRTVKLNNTSYEVYMWIVPAQIAGNWSWTNGGKKYSLRVDQNYQRISGTLSADGTSIPIRDGVLEGSALRFIADVPQQGGPRVATTFEGRVEGGEIQGRSVVSAGGHGSQKTSVRASGGGLGRETPWHALKDRRARTR